MIDLVLAATALALLTLFVYLMLTVLGVMAKARGQLSDQYSLTKAGSPPPDWLGNWGRNLANLFELPVLYYALVAAYAAVGSMVEVDGLQVTLAWAFAISRIIHTLVHVTINNMALRFLTHRIGFVILAILWIRFAIAIHA